MQFTHADCKIIVERLFSYEGLGNIHDAVINRDLPLIKVAVILALLYPDNLAADLLYVVLNPLARDD